MRRRAREFLDDSGGAVAPTLALSLLALIAVGGIAFDYARMASMDTELQNAADQAALAAASQLTGDTGACARAANAAANMVTNTTLMANDGAGLAVTLPNEPTCDDTGQIRFYQDKEKTVAATSDENAIYVEVDVNPRTAFYALTPVVAAFQSGPIDATAFATLGEAYCKIPPVMICNPQETETNKSFDWSGLDGVGMRLVSVGGGTGGWAPGNFGYLDMDGLSNGAPGLREALGWDPPPSECVPDSGLDTKPGATVDVTDSINTRFDIYDNVACPSGGACPASINSIKDFKRPAETSGGNSCAVHNTGWKLDTSGTGYYGYDYPRTVAPLDPSITPTAMGHPRDICHAVDPAVAGACTEAIGDGVWDRDAYFRTNYGWDHATWVAAVGLGETPRRYDVYLWEIENRGDVVAGRTILGPNPAGATGSTPVAHGTPVCSPSEGYGAGVDPSTGPDRRKVTVAVVNCLEQGVNGNSVNIQTIGWLEVFLVEPSWNRQRSHQGDVYVEVIDSSTQSIQLVSKKVPVLIE